MKEQQQRQQQQIQPCYPTLDVYLNVTKVYVHNKTSRRMFIAALFIIIKMWKQPKYPSTGE